MLSNQAFQAGMSFLAMNYDRNLPDPILMIWREYLDRELSDDEFLESVKHSILHSRFMPTAGELVDFIKSGKEARAIQEWQIILQACRRRDYSALTSLSDRGRAALQSVGGVHQIELTEERQYPGIEKKFSISYCQLSERDTKAIASFPLPTSPETATSPSEEPQDSVPMPEEVRRQIGVLKAKLAMSRKK